MRVLVSGANIAAPVWAYWLTRHGFSVTVVERRPERHKTGGHSIFGPAAKAIARPGPSTSGNNAPAPMGRLARHRNPRRSTMFLLRGSSMSSWNMTSIESPSVFPPHKPPRARPSGDGIMAG